MSNQPTHGVTRSSARLVLWVPMVIAACVSLPLLAFAAVVRLVGVAAALGAVDLYDLPPGVTTFKPSGWDLTVGVLGHVAPVVAGVALLALTLFFGVRGQSRPCWICAVAACLVSIGSATPSGWSPSMGAPELVVTLSLIAGVVIVAAIVYGPAWLTKLGRKEREGRQRSR